jgi:hypothetical protein
MAKAEITETHQCERKVRERQNLDHIIVQPSLSVSTVLPSPPSSSFRRSFIIFSVALSLFLAPAVPPPPAAAELGLLNMDLLRWTCLAREERKQSRRYLAEQGWSQGSKAGSLSEDRRRRPKAS